MNTNQNDDLTRDVIVAGLIVVAIIYVVPKLIKAGAYLAIYTYYQFGKCYKLTAIDENGDEYYMKITRKEAILLGIIEE